VFQEGVIYGLYNIIATLIHNTSLYLKGISRSDLVF